MESQAADSNIQSFNNVLSLFSFSKNKVGLSEISGEALMQKEHLELKEFDAKKTPASSLMTSPTCTAPRHAVMATAG